MFLFRVSKKKEKKKTPKYPSGKVFTLWNVSYEMYLIFLSKMPGDFSERPSYTSNSKSFFNHIQTLIRDGSQA
jgi:hypothetical protein